MQLAALEAKLRFLKTEQRTDPHARFRYWHEVTGCWRHSTARTRYHDATVDSPRGTRSSWTKLRSVKSFLHEVCAELGENWPSRNASATQCTSAPAGPPNSNTKSATFESTSQKAGSCLGQGFREGKRRSEPRTRMDRTQARPSPPPAGCPQFG